MSSVLVAGILSAPQHDSCSQAKQKQQVQGFTDQNATWLKPKAQQLDTRSKHDLPGAEDDSDIDQQPQLKSKPSLGAASRQKPQTSGCPVSVYCCGAW